MIANISQKIKFTPSIQIILGAISLLLLALEVYLYTLPTVSTLAFLVYILVAGHALGTRISGKKGLQWLCGITILLSTISLIGVLAYYPYKITPEISLLSLILPLLFLFKKKKTVVTEKEVRETRKKSIFIYVFFALELFLLGMILSARSGELMPSPWLAFSPWFFIVFAISTSTFLYLLKKKVSAPVLLLGTLVHFFIIYSIAAIVYKLGFGFDGFIHRATETWILHNGFINPKEPFYIGQYGFVVTLSRLTGISVNYIDIFLLPVLASISIPAFIYTILPRAWKILKHTALGLSFLVPFVFYVSFNLTTPHNLVLLLMLLTSISLIGYFYRVAPYLLPITLALTASATHPLLGAPLMLIVIAGILFRKFESKKVIISGSLLLIILLACIPVFMFSLQLLLSGYPVPQLVNPFTHLDAFIELFKRPFWYKAQSVWYLEILYFWQLCITPFTLILSLIGWIKLRKQNAVATLLIVSAIGLTFSSFLLRSWVVFPNVASHEQGNYPMRLLVGAMILLIPLAMYGGYSLAKTKLQILQNYLKINVHSVYILASVKIGVLLTLSLYFAYPQYNGKVFFPGYNVTDYDYKAVQWIHDQNITNDYVVLSTILTSVAALSEFSFASHFQTKDGELFYYSIPSGGPLYKFYEEMLYEGQKRKTINDVFTLTNAHKVYFVVSWYWKDSNKIVESAKKTADSWYSIDDRMWIFEYKR